MMPGASIGFFAASYAIALVLELTRPLFRSGVRGALMLGFAGAGLFVHTVFLAYRIVVFYEASKAGGSPLAIKQDWYLVAAWVLVVTYLLLTFLRPKTAFGVFILPLVLGLVAVGTFLAAPEPFARGPASKVWAFVHAASLLLATVAVLVGFVAGLMYLGQAYRLKHKLPPQRGLRLPSLEWLQRTNGRALVIAMVMLGVGIVSGVVLNAISYGRPGDRLPWNDPVVLSTLVMFAWLLISISAGRFYRPAREGRKVAYLTVVSFVFLVIALALVLFGNTQHGGERQAQSEEGAQASARALRIGRGTNSWDRECVGENCRTVPLRVDAGLVPRSGTTLDGRGTVPFSRRDTCCPRQPPLRRENWDSPRLGSGFGARRGGDSA